MKRKQEGHAGSVVKGIGIGVAAACVISLGAAMILGAMIINGNMSEGSVKIWVMIVQAISTFSCALIAGKLSDRRLLPVCAGASLCYCLLMIGIKIIVFDGQFEGVGRGALMYCVGTVLACMLSALRVKKRMVRT